MDRLQRRWTNFTAGWMPFSMPAGATGAAAAASPAASLPESVGAREASGSFRLLWNLIASFRSEYLGLVVVSSLLSGAEGVLQPLLIKSIFDQGVIKSDFHRFFILALCYLLLGLTINLASSGVSLWSKSLDNRLTASLTRRMLRSFYQQDYASILKNGHGYFINRIYGDVREGLVPFLSLIRSSVNQAVLLVALSAILIYFSWRAFLILAAIIPISAAVGTLLGKKVKVLTAREREQEGSVLAILTKALGAFRMVRGFHLLLPTSRVFDDQVDRYLSTGYKRYKVARWFQALNDSTMVISDFFSMFVGALFVLKGALSFGAYLAFVNTFWRAVTTLMQLFNRMPDVQSYGVVVQRIGHFLSPSIAPFHQLGQAPAVSGVSFAYGGDNILKDFSLNLTLGERVVIVGPNGSGKTTLANLLSGYLAPSEGKLTLPERISSVTLPVSLPPLRVRDLMAKTHLLAAFRLDEDAVLDAFADDLSAGQQQKLAICLALSQPADLYVLDEPLANLDQGSRDIAVELMLQETAGMTLVVVMHGGEEFYRVFDRVITMEAGARKDAAQDQMLVST